MIVLQLAVLTVLLVPVPWMIGRLVISRAGFTEMSLLTGILAMILAGNLVMWACFQAITLPFVLTESSFLLPVMLWCVLTAFFLFLSFLTYRSDIRHSRPGVLSRVRQKLSRTDLLFLFLSILLVGYQCYKFALRMHLDEDDARFVALAVDAWKNNRMFVVHPGNGDYIGLYVADDFAKDVSSPWPLFLALFPKLTGVHPAVFAHTIYPVYLLLLSYAAYLLMGYFLFQKNRTKTLAFLAAAALMQMFFGGGSHSEAAFALIRIWQGKALLAALGIPLFFTLYIKLVQDRDRRLFFPLFLLNMSCCLFSSIGIIFSGTLSLVFLVWYIIGCRRWRDFPAAAISCIPSLVYVIVFIALTQRWWV